MLFKSKFNLIFFINMKSDNEYNRVIIEWNNEFDDHLLHYCFTFILWNFYVNSGMLSIKTDLYLYET